MSQVDFSCTVSRPNLKISVFEDQWRELQFLVLKREADGEWL